VPSRAGRRLRVGFYQPGALDVAPLLLNKLLVRADGRAGRIVEVEAYRGRDDPASHAYRGPTARNAVMWGPPGRLYVYFTYGMHWCANVVCGPEGAPEAVLLRALDPLRGLEAMRAARWGERAAKPDRDLCRGPARLCQALGIDRALNGADLTSAAQGIWLSDDDTPSPDRPDVSRRIGVSAGVDLEWRFSVAGHPAVSGRARPGAAPPR
jgi:DNA-3-methyladenine glycosylase